MTPLQIEKAFHIELNKRGIQSRLPGITEDQVYNWRKGRKVPTFGEMLYVLYLLNKITINESSPNP